MSVVTRYIGEHDTQEMTEHQMLENIRLMRKALPEHDSVRFLYLAMLVSWHEQKPVCFQMKQDGSGMLYEFAESVSKKAEKLAKANQTIIDPTLTMEDID